MNDMRLQILALVNSSTLFAAFLTIILGGCAVSDKPLSSARPISSKSDPTAAAPANTQDCPKHNRKAASIDANDNAPDLNDSDESPAWDDYDLLEDELGERMVEVADPLEPLNRLMYGINDILYFWVAKPISQLYKNVAPEPIRICLSNFFHNLTTPARFINCHLQGKVDSADIELKRFLINTTSGILGFGDPAQDKMGLEPVEEDLGQTLAVHGFGNGFYIVWPLFGPSTLRDSVGFGGDQLLNPTNYVKPVEVSIGLSGTKITNESSFRIGEYEAFKSAAVDPYVAMRQAYIQYRARQIKE